MAYPANRGEKTTGSHGEGDTTKPYASIHACAVEDKENVRRRLKIYRVGHLQRFFFEISITGCLPPGDVRNYFCLRLCVHKWYVMILLFSRGGNSMSPVRRREFEFRAVLFAPCFCVFENTR